MPRPRFHVSEPPAGDVASLPREVGRTRRGSRGIAWWIVNVVVVVTACGSGQIAPPCTVGKPCQFPGGTYPGWQCVGLQAYDNGQPVCSCGCAAGPGDAGADGSAALDSSSAAPEAGVCGSGPPSACNQLANIGTVITATCVSGAPPTMSGGVIADGTYVLVSAAAYAASCTGVSLPTGGPTTIVISAGCEQSIDVTGGAKTYSWTTSGSTLSSVQVCPGSFPFSLQYTATPTTLAELAPLSAGISVVSVFQRQ